MPDNRYSQIIQHIFQARYAAGDSEVVFDRQEIADVALHLGLERPKNLGDVVYSFRFRTQLPPAIRETAPAGREWVIRKGVKANIASSWLQSGPSYPALTW